MNLNEMFNKAINSINEEKNSFKLFNEKMERDRKLFSLEIVKNWEFFDQNINNFDMDCHKILNKKIEKIIPKFIDFRKNANKLSSEKNKVSLYSAELNKKKIFSLLQVDKSEKEIFPSVSMPHSQRDIFLNKLEKKKTLYSHLHSKNILENNTKKKNKSKSLSINVSKNRKFTNGSTLETTNNNNPIDEESLKLIKSQSDLFSKKTNLNEKQFIENIQNNKKIPIIYNSLDLVPKKTTTIFNFKDSKVLNPQYYINKIDNKLETINNIKKMKTKKISMNVFNLIGRGDYIPNMTSKSKYIFPQNVSIIREFAEKK